MDAGARGQRRVGGAARSALAVAALAEDRVDRCIARTGAEIACGRAQLVIAHHVAGRRSDALQADGRLRAVLAPSVTGFGAQ